MIEEGGSIYYRVCSASKGREKKRRANKNLSKGKQAKQKRAKINNNTLEKIATKKTVS